MTTTLSRAGLAFVAAAGLALLLAMPSGAASPGTSTAKRCGLTVREQQSVPHGYLTELDVRGTSCRHGKAVERAFQTCRRHGRGGRCHHAVLHYGCRERRASGQGVRSSSTTCRRGRAKVHFNYSIFT